MKTFVALERAIDILYHGRYYPHEDDKDISFKLMKLRDSIKRRNEKVKGKSNAKRSSEVRETTA
jgi:hypothetical protein